MTRHMKGSSRKRGTHGLRKRCPQCKILRKFYEPPGDVGGENHRGPAWVKYPDLRRWVCGYCVTRPIKVVEAKAYPNFKLVVDFEDGRNGCVDLSKDGFSPEEFATVNLDATQSRVIWFWSNPPRALSAQELYARAFGLSMAGTAEELRLAACSKLGSGTGWLDTMMPALSLTDPGYYVAVYADSGGLITKAPTLDDMSELLSGLRRHGLTANVNIRALPEKSEVI